MKHEVQHYVSVDPEDQVITRARVVTGGRTDDVSLFIGDTICGTLCVPAGKGRAFCEQLRLIDRNVCSLATIQREFKRMLSASE